MIELKDKASDVARYTGTVSVLLGDMLEYPDDEQDKRETYGYALEYLIGKLTVLTQDLLTMIEEVAA